MLFPKQKRIRDRRHLEFVRTFPCVKCFAECTHIKDEYARYHQVPNEAHHITIGTNRGIALKAGDNFTISLCRNHHDMLHRHGERTFWGDNLDKAISLAKSLYEVSGDRKAAIALIKGAAL